MNAEPGGRPAIPAGSAAATARTRGADESGFVLEEQVGYRLRLAMQRYHAIFADRMVEGLTPTQFAALVKLAAHGPCSQNRLGRLIALDAATIRGVVARLRDRGLIEAACDEEDRRRRALRLTEAGRAAAARAVPAALAVSKAMLAPLGEAERTAFLLLLKKLG